MEPRPAGELWIEVQFIGGPKDGELSSYRAPGSSASPILILDAAHDPAQGVHPGDLLHRYEFSSRAGGEGAYEYRGTERAPEGSL